MRGSIPAFTQYVLMAWCLVNHRDNLTLPLPILRFRYVCNQLLVYADDVNLLGDSVNTIKEKTETLLETSTDVGLEINAEKTSI